jgi:adenine-specific DNA methylase
VVSFMLQRLDQGQELTGQIVANILSSSGVIARGSLSVGSEILLGAVQDTKALMNCVIAENKCPAPLMLKARLDPPGPLQARSQH